MTQPCELILSYFPESRSDGQIDVSARAKGFAGQSGHVVDARQLDAFAKALTAYPLRSQAALTIGAEFDDGPLIHIAVWQANALGRLRVDMEIADWQDRSCRASTHFFTTYTELDAFHGELLRLIEGGGSVTLRGAPDIDD